MDNLNLHTTDKVRKAIEDTGAKLVFLPTYSPDLSPIDMFWSKVKSILRSIAPRTTEQLHAAITVAFNSVSTSNLFGWFYECDARTVLIWKSPYDNYELLERLLLEKIPLAGIARVLKVSERWLQSFVNDKYENVAQQVEVAPKPKRRLIVQMDEIMVFCGWQRQ